MSETARYSLRDLHRLSGVEPRTIRSWIQQGLVPGPGSRGRGADYGEEALTRVLAVKAMRERFAMPLSAIRQELLLADPERLAAYAREALGDEQPAASADATGVADLESAPPGSTAAEYLQALRESGVFSAGGAVRPPPRPLGGPPPGADSSSLHRGGTAPSSSPLERLAAHLETPLGGRTSSTRPRADVRLVLPVTPDIELVVRGDLNTREIVQLERIAAALRELLIGGYGDD